MFPASYFNNRKSPTPDKICYRIWGYSPKPGSLCLRYNIIKYFHLCSEENTCDVKMI